MNLSTISVRRGVTFFMLYLILVGFGFFSLSRLQLDLFPDVSFPTVVIITNYTGASPEDIETLITRPIEGAAAGVEDVEEVQSESKQNISVVMANFDWGKDMDQAETDVRRALEMVEGFLPEDADDPMVFAFDPSMQPIVMMMVRGPYPLDELRHIAENDLQPLIERLPGVASAYAAGGLEREIHVVLDPVKVAAYGLDVNAVLGAVYAENSQIPGGAIQQGSLEFTIQTKGKYQRVAEIGEVLVGMRPAPAGFGVEPLRLKDVASIEDSYYESQRVLEVDGEPAVWMYVRKQSGANTVRTAEAVLDALPKLARAVGAEIEFKLIFNQAEFINLSLGNLSSTGLIGVLISFVILLLFLRNVRSALIVSTAIPLSVIATFTVMDSFDMTLNVLSMAGLALAIGMLVDNAIVVLENVFRLREEGVGPWDAAIQGARGVGTAVTASTLTTISVFVPVLFVPGIAGVLFKDMAVTICAALAVSLLVALTFIPLAASRVLGGVRVGRPTTAGPHGERERGLRGFYGRMLDWSLCHRWVVGLGVAGVVALAISLWFTVPTEFITEEDRSLLFVSVETPIGNNLEETTAIMHEVADVIAEVVKPEERKLIGLDAGVGKGFVSIFAKGVHAGVLRVPLVLMGQRDRSQAQLEDLVRKALAKKVPGIKVTVAPPFNPMGGEGDIEIQIRGHDLETSRKTGLELREKLLAWPEMTDVTFSMEDQKPELRVRFDRVKMAELGISAASVGNAISAFFMGRVAGRYAEGGDEYDILVRYAKEHRQDIEELRHMPVATKAGTVPLANIAEIKQALGPVSITRLDQERVTKLICYLADEYESNDGEKARKDLGGSIGRVTEFLDAYKWPKDFTYLIGGSSEDFMTSMKWLGVALMVSILLVYMVMASQFESLRQPFIIIIAVPLSAIGVALMFVISRATMDVSSLVGVIMLVGIVVNNGIVMIDAANQLRAEGKDRREAIALASRMRLRPVLMTSLTTIMAMVPLALEIGEGAAGWGGMAKAVIGGLFASTFLTLLVVPTMYTLFARKTMKEQPECRSFDGVQP
ncbi:MAG: efflux RND transporter permease subunit [Deltaproteobacteria bacterium]|nr:efflux RND transporter permease subunit [Deltaproteobacteria bacterium]